MNLDKFEHLLAKLPVKDKSTNVSVPFTLNPNQAIAMKALKKQYAEFRNIRTICCKARRVGMSSLIDALLFGHCLARPQAHAEIVAQLKDTSEKGLFRVPRDLALAINRKVDGTCQVFKRNIEFIHSDGNSMLDIATAGTVVGGRGLTLTALHLSEAAMYPGSDSFLSVLPAVSKGEDTIIAIESTPFGRTGIGQVFYDFWNRANQSGRSWNGYVPIFLSWLDDPECVRPEDEAEDAPATDLERELMRKPWFATRAQIAWMRRVFESECEAQENKFMQEYGWCAEVAFVATGDPAFPKKEINYALGTKKAPLWRGSVRRNGESAEFIPDNTGSLLVWEWPKPNCYYYIGGDAAAGYESGDFACLNGFNGTTGNQAFTLTDHIHPEELAECSDLLGRKYNNAMVNIELTGNLGRWAQKILRDQLIYPNLYVWKGKDDKSMGKGKSTALGWETTSATRGLMFDAFRQALRDGVKEIPGGITIYDAELVRQMDIATFTEGLRWEVTKGHDDVLCAAMLAVVARAQYPPPNILAYRVNVIERGNTKAGRLGFLNPQETLQKALRQDLRRIFKPPQSRPMRSIGNY